MLTFKTLPDIVKSQTNEQSYALNWVGMQDIAVPLTIAVNNGNVKRLKRLSISAFNVF
jgi:GTP cyclohydrolase FolE2